MFPSYVRVSWIEALMRPDRQEKMEKILQAAAEVLADKGYESATIKDIAAAAHVNWGLLHYYFKNKEDLVVRTLRYASDVTFTPTLGLFGPGKSIEEIVDNAVILLKNTFHENPGFYKLLFEMWCASGRSKKIKAELVLCVNRVTETLQKELEQTTFVSNVADNVKDCEGQARLLLALSTGLAFDLILDPRKLNDKKTWRSFRVAALAVLDAVDKNNSVGSETL